MATQKTQVPAVEGWFEMNFQEPHLLGSRCSGCQTYFFPAETTYCRNPSCNGTSFETVPLSSTGTLWSFTDNRYKPPAPYVSTDPFEPYIVAAVELDAEKLVVLGQVVRGVGIADLAAGMKMQLVLDTLFEDDDKQHIVWKWKPVV